MADPNVNLDDSALYTGAGEGEPSTGMFGNEIENEDIKRLKEEQKQQIAMLMPKFDQILEIIDSEIKGVDNISNLGNPELIAKMSAEEIKIQILARSTYKEYLSKLRTKFDLDKNAAQKLQEENSEQKGE
ncbi:MAG: hypothetical protein Q8910_01595 [Bacteroidota bacterium]|nr:hypothetical protein [Bacteroidota bacterium]